MFEQVVSAARWTIVHFVLAEIQGGEREGKKAEFPLQKDKKCRCNWDIWECLVSGSRGEMKPVRLERLTDSKASPLRLTFSLASPSSPLFFPHILSLLLLFLPLFLYPNRPQTSHARLGSPPLLPVNDSSLIGQV